MTAEALLRNAMHAVGAWYPTRVAFAWDQLSITEERDRIIPAVELAGRLSKVLGRPVSRELFLEYCQHQPEDPKVLDCLARVLDVEALWLRAESAATD